MARDAWRSFGYAVESAESSFKRVEYAGVFDAPIRSWRDSNFPAGALTPEQVPHILSENALGPPHGLELLTPVPMPSMPKLPTVPTEPGGGDYDYRLSRYKKLVAAIEDLQQRISDKIEADREECGRLAASCSAGDANAVASLLKLTLLRHQLPDAVELGAEVAFDATARVALCTVEVPDLARLRFVRKRGSSWSAKWHQVGAAEVRRSSQTLLRALCVRAAYLVAMSDPGDFFDTVAVNAHQKWFDPATGAPRDGIVASLQATKFELAQLNPGRLDADACFRHLAGIATPNVLNAAPVRPIFVLNRSDARIVADRDVAAGLEREANLAAMPWEDFEHLVRQLFEWMFTSDGVEVRVTRASRDRGVDAIIFDPDPLRGGKYVVQAKRYTRLVDVAAVRDLYGTVMNEGANRGILVTTSSYGPDAYDFAKDKPISLVDGPNLIALLKKHGRAYRIDLEEARRLADPI